MSEVLGKHLIIEYYGCPSDILNDQVFLEKSLREAALISGAKIRSVNFHTFNPPGVSGVVIIEESHLTIHTWPEKGYAAVDIFTCGEKMNPWKAQQFLEKALKCRSSQSKMLERGFSGLG